MSILWHLRPNFHLCLESNSKEVMCNLNNAHKDSLYEWKCTSHHASLAISEEYRKIWSPYLSIELIDNKESGCCLIGKFSPRQDIWTAVVFAYMGLATLTSFMTCWGMAQLILKKAPMALIVVPICLFFILGIYVISYIGQKLSKHQIEELGEQFKQSMTNFDFEVTCNLSCLHLTADISK